MQLFIKPLTKTPFTLDVEPTETIQQLKSKIRESQGISIKQQRLVYAGKVLDDLRRISFYNIQNENTLHLVESSKEIIDMPIYVKTMVGDHFAFSVESSQPVYALKKAIWYLEGIPVDEQNLVFGSKTLEDYKTFQEYGVRSGSTLNLVLALKSGAYSFNNY